MPPTRADDAQGAWFLALNGNPMLRLPVFPVDELQNAEAQRQKFETMLERINDAEKNGSKYCVLNPTQLVLFAHCLYRQSKETVVPDNSPGFEPEQLQCFASIGHIVNKSNLQSTLVKLAQRVQTQQVTARR